MARPKGQSQNTGETNPVVVPSVTDAGTNDVQDVERQSTDSNQQETDSSQQETDSEEEHSENGMPFKTENGLVEVISKCRAGKAVYGTTGEIVRFDKDGRAYVKPEDALHFKKIPGFEIK